MKLIELKCPACGAEMKVNSDINRVICVYCGKEMLVDNGVTELVIANGYDYGYEQEMGRLKAQEDFRIEQQKREDEEKEEAERLLKEKQEQEIQHLEEEKARKKKKWVPWFWSTVILGAVGLLLVALGGFTNAASIVGIVIVIVAFCTAYFVYGRIFGQNPTDYNVDGDYVLFPKGMEPFNVLDFGEALMKLKEAGFTNITCRNLHDVRLGILTQEGKVQNIRVSGKIIYSGGNWYPKYIPILITYHGK
ncbi:MAG: hypothetical protein IK014_01370 [Lachnospiraceae bacterium]|nr:hypothetical protein [Lachnospiraceae bacterium]